MVYLIVQDFLMDLVGVNASIVLSITFWLRFTAQNLDDIVVFGNVTELLCSVASITLNVILPVICVFIEASYLDMFDVGVFEIYNAWIWCFYKDIPQLASDEVKLIHRSDLKGSRLRFEIQTIHVKFFVECISVCPNIVRYNLLEIVRIEVKDQGVTVPHIPHRLYELLSVLVHSNLRIMVFLVIFSEAQCYRDQSIEALRGKLGQSLCSRL